MSAGRFFEMSIRSFTECTGRDGCTTSRFCDSATSVMKAKSLTGSKASLIRAGLVAWAGALRTMVCPSGTERAATSAATAVLAPLRFSTTTGCPRYSESFGASARARMSLVPPGGNPMRKRIGLLGYPWAKQVAVASSSAAASVQVVALIPPPFAIRHPPSAMLLLALDSRRLDHLVPLGDLVLHERSVLLGRVSDRVGAETLQALASIRCIHRSNGIRMQPIEDRARYLCRRGHAVSRRHFVARQPALRHCRDIGCRRRALGAGSGDGAHLSGARLADDGRDVAEIERYFTRHQRDQTWPASLVGNVYPLGAGHVLKQFRREMHRSAGARGAVVDVSRAFLRERDQLLHRPRRERRMYHQQVLGFRQQRDERKIVDRVEIELHYRRVGGVARRHQKDGIAVRRSVCREIGSDRSVGAAAVLDHHRLAEELGKFRRDCACDDIVGATRREADEKTDRLHGVGRLRDGGRRHAGKQQGGEQAAERSTHWIPPLCGRALAVQGRGDHHD